MVSCDIQEGSGTKIAKEAGARFVSCDVSSPDSVESAFGEAEKLLGGLDVLVHAAGIAPGIPAEQITAGEWDQVLDINAKGTFLTNQAAYRRLAEHGGRIINFASAAGVIGLRNKAHYAASKGAVLGWTRIVAQEWGAAGVTVNTIAPAISTPMYAKTRASMTVEQLAAHDAQLKGVMPIDGRLGEVERDLVPLLVFLAGPGARFITGQVFAVDGGMLMVR